MICEKDDRTDPEEMNQGGAAKMKNKINAGIIIRKAFILAAAILMITAGAVSVNAATAADLDDSYSGKTVILQSNDVHGALEGYQYIAGLRDELVKRGADVVMVDSGDFMQGSTYVAENKGLNAIRMMNECGYEYITVGNHEFDYDTIRLPHIQCRAI